MGNCIIFVSSEPLWPIEARNAAESALHDVRKDFEEVKSDLTDTETSDVESAIKLVEDAAKGDDVNAFHVNFCRIRSATIDGTKGEMS